MDQSPSPESEEKAANADQTPDAQPVPDEVVASEHKEAELSPSKDQQQRTSGKIFLLSDGAARCAAEC